MPRPADGATRLESQVEVLVDMMPGGSAPPSAAPAHVQAGARMAARISRKRGLGVLTSRRPEKERESHTVCGKVPSPAHARTPHEVAATVYCSAAKPAPRCAVPLRGQRRRAVSSATPLNLLL